MKDKKRVRTAAGQIRTDPGEKTKETLKKRGYFPVSSK